MNPFDTAWDFFKAADRRSIADPSASEGSSGGHMSRKERFRGAGFPSIRAAGYGPTGDSSGLAGSSGKGRQVKDYFAEPGATAPDPSEPVEEKEPDYDPNEAEAEVEGEDVYANLSAEQFPEGAPSRAQPPSRRGNPFVRSEPFDAAWGLLKQYGAARAMGWDIPTDWMSQMQNQQVAQQQVQQPTAANTVGAPGQAQQDAQAFGQHLAGTTVGNVAQGGTLAPPGLTHMTQAPNTFQQPIGGGEGTTLSAPGGY